MINSKETMARLMKKHRMQYYDDMAKERPHIIAERDALARTCDMQRVALIKAKQEIAELMKSVRILRDMNGV